jgi:hypothetical protein
MTSPSISAPASSKVPMAKGTCWRSLFSALSELHGPDSVDRVAAELPPDLAARIRSKDLLTSQWYPLGWFSTTYATARRVLGGGPSFARDVGRVSTIHDLQGVYKVFLLFVSPQYFLSKAPLMFSSYYSVGRMMVVDPERGSVRARWEGCVGFDRNLWEDLLGVADGALTAAGAKGVGVELISGGRDGDTGCEMRATWR